VFGSILAVIATTGPGDTDFFLRCSRPRREKVLVSKERKKQKNCA
jgi:hypothetical protein